VLTCRASRNQWASGCWVSAINSCALRQQHTSRRHVPVIAGRTQGCVALPSGAFQQTQAVAAGKRGQQGDQASPKPSRHRAVPATRIPAFSSKQLAAGALECGHGHPRLTCERTAPAGTGRVGSCRRGTWARHARLLPHARSSSAAQSSPSCLQDAGAGGSGSSNAERSKRVVAGGLHNGISQCTATNHSTFVPEPNCRPQ